MAKAMALGEEEEEEEVILFPSLYGKSCSSLPELDILEGETTQKHEVFSISWPWGGRISLG